VLTQWLLGYANGLPGAADTEEDFRIVTDERGWTPRLPTLDVVRARGLLQAERPYEAAAPPTRRAIAAIRASAAAAKRAGATYVLVNVPEHAFRWSAPGGPVAYAAYLSAMTDLAAREGFQFLDVTHGDPRRFHDDADYSDYHHMSPAGAHRFTRALAQEFSPAILTTAQTTTPPPARPRGDGEVR